MDRNTIRNKIYLSTFLIIIVLLKRTISQSNMEIDSLRVEINQLEDKKEQLQNQKDFLEGVLERNKQEREILTSKVKELKEENEHLRIIRAKLTAYSPLDNRDGQQAEGDPKKTSIGKQVSRGIVAADPKKLPYGTKLEIPDWGIVEVGDTGGALRRDKKNIRIDLYHETYEDAMKFGVKDAEIKIVEWGGIKD